MPPQSDNPNPQGKGLAPILGDWQALQLRSAGAKAPDQFLRDYCISSLVLSAKFSFKPVKGRAYFLYATGDEWLLSLVSPLEWGKKQPGDFVGRCQLRDDMTWQLEKGELEEDSPLAQRIRTFIESFIDNLASQDSIASTLPYYVSGLPYYQRLLATALAASLQQTLHASDDTTRALLDNTQALPALLAPDIEK